MCFSKDVVQPVLEHMPTNPDLVLCTWTTLDTRATIWMVRVAFLAEIRRSVHFQTNTNEAAKRPLRCAFFTDWMKGNPYAMISET